MRATVPFILTATLLAGAASGHRHAAADEGPALQSTAPIPPASAPAVEIIVTEGLVNRLLARESRETDGVRDRILGADVFGTQTTTTRLSVDFRPSPASALAYFRLDGVTCVESVGYREIAAVTTWGRHGFALTKPVLFDGRRFSTSHPTANVAPHNITVAARTTLAGIPLIGPFADRQAFATAESQRPAAEAIAAAKLAERTSTRFNRQSDARLAQGNDLLRRGISRLERMRVVPDRLSLSTTDAELIYRAGWDGVVPAERAPERPVPAGGARIAVDESAVQSLIDRLNLGGRTFADTEMDALADRIGSFVELDPVEAEGESDDEDEPPMATIVLDEREPLRIAFADGRLVVTIVARFRPVVGDEVPAHRIVIAYRATLTEDQMVLEPEPVEVEPVKPAVGIAGEVARALITRQVQDRLERLVLARERTMTPIGERPLTLRMQDLVLRDGWLVLTAE